MMAIIICYKCSYLQGLAAASAGEKRQEFHTERSGKTAYMFGGCATSYFESSHLAQLIRLCKWSVRVYRSALSVLLPFFIT